MTDTEDFHHVFGSGANAPHYAAVVKKIRENRKKLGGELYIERLLKALGLQDVSKLYPPGDQKGLKELHGQIVASSSPDHYKHSVLFYLCKDLDAEHAEYSRYLKKDVYLPSKYETFVNGIWCLDRLMFDMALDFLTDPALTPTFPEEILYTLCTYTRPQEHGLALAYYNTVSPLITSAKVLHAYFKLLCEISVAEAFWFARTQPHMDRLQLLEELVISVIVQDHGEKKAVHATELVKLPMDADEEACFQKTLKAADTEKSTDAPDILIMRDTLTCKSNLSNERLRSASRKKIEGVNWKAVAAPLQDPQS